MRQQAAIAVTIALATTLALPLASAHWRGIDVPSWDAPQGHMSMGPGTLTATAYSTEAQRLCLNAGTLSITWSNPTNGACGPGTIPISPVRGVSLGANQCFDLNHAFYVETEIRFGGIQSVALDWGAGTWGPLTAFSDFYAHPNRLGRFTWPTDPNPTGASVDFYPGYSATPGVVQVSVTSTGAGTTSNPVVHGHLFPGVDQGDNDLETCYGGASHTYAIDSGHNKWVCRHGPNPCAGPPVVGVGGGYGLNDPSGIGGDCVYDITFFCSPLIDKGSTFPATSALPLGVLLSPTMLLGTSVRYSVCNDVAISGCTNIPDAGTSFRYGNGAGEDAVYASLQDCVWDPFQMPRFHVASGNSYRGQAAQWGTGISNGLNCWPERLSRVSTTPGTLYLPSSQATSTWKPDHLPATPRAVERITVFIDSVGDYPLHHFDSGCPHAAPFNPLSPFCSGGPTMAPPTAWVQTPGAIATLNAVFQP